ncbi:beta-galactosidase GalB [Pseudopedobacter beijingensis]|uniref:Beta-galactosidase GalB n=1 Tax=Pseudopedobacter beijingensis TaxID=1207056 RepID=A0ABW4I988_9SPHI
MKLKIALSVFTLFPFFGALVYGQNLNNTRQKEQLNQGWKFYKYQADETPDNLIYDVRPEVNEYKDNIPADSKPTDAVKVQADKSVLKSWILPSGNDFIKDPAKRYLRPVGNPGEQFPFVQKSFDDSTWESVQLPHDWAIKGPFYEGWDTEIGGGMGRLPVQGVAWYRNKISIPQSDKGKRIYLDVDGAMSYAMVWVNGKLAGGWPFGYTSWSLDITPYLDFGKENQIAIRLDNPANSSRWYPGAGLYRNVWLTKVAPVHVKTWGTFVTSKNISAKSANVNLNIELLNQSPQKQIVSISTEIFQLGKQGEKLQKVASDKAVSKSLDANTSTVVKTSLDIQNPKLWKVLPQDGQNLYIAVTQVKSGNQLVDIYETKFGIRDLHFDAKKGVIVNGEKVYIKGVNQHHDLGALGGAFNQKAARRQLELLKEMGCNAIRMAHNPPAPELLDLTDEMGFLVIDEIYDSWEKKKTPLDFHLIFPDWYEQDLRALIRRDRNHPSVIMWSYGNEVGEQYTEQEGTELSRKLNAIVKDEDTTRPTTVSMNYAKPNMPFSGVTDVINLNYQGEGIRNGAGYEGLKGITTPPLYTAFHDKYPDKMIISSENAATLSSRGEYLFPVTNLSSAPAKDGSGADPKTMQVSAYELYSVEFGSSADKVFAATEQHPFVAGGFVWSGWDYLGEPTPYYLARSSYFGIIDLAGFKKDRFYQYQAHWRPDFPMVHILPHWTWPERTGLTTPVHVLTSGDEVELFLNGKSLGKKRKGQYEYRLRWDDVKYEAGELKAIAYKNGKIWSENSVKTAGNATKLVLKSEDKTIRSDGEDLTFITVQVSDNNGIMVPKAKNRIRFSIEGPGEIVATDNGDPTDLTSFAAYQRNAFNGLCLVIVKAQQDKTGVLKIKAEADGLISGEIPIKISN